VLGLGVGGGAGGFDLDRGDAAARVFKDEVDLAASVGITQVVEPGSATG